MAAGPILTVLSNIPWGTVVDNAPKLAEGASKLWTTVSRRKKPGAEQGMVVEAPTDAPLHATDALSERLLALEDQVRRLDEQMQASSELIKGLAEQNTLLVQQIELSRLRLRRLRHAAAVVAAVLLASQVWLAFFW